MNLNEQINKVNEAEREVLEEPSGDARAARLKIVGRIREMLIAIDIEMESGRQPKPIKEAELSRLFSSLTPNEVA